MNLLVLFSTLLLFELSVISAHVIPETKLNVTDIYEVQENNKTSIRLINPKSDKPVVREIFYYHVIEKPYGDDQSQEGKVITDGDPDFDETRRPFTNSHGYQFREEPNDEEYIDEEFNDEKSIDGESNDEESNVTNQSKELIPPNEPANVRKDVFTKTEAKILEEPKNEELNVTDQNREFIIPDELTNGNADDIKIRGEEVEVPIDEIEEHEEKIIDYEVPKHATSEDNVNVNTTIIGTDKVEISSNVEEHKTARNRLFDQVKARYQKNRKHDVKPGSRRKREIVIPEAPKLGKLNYDNFPEYIRKLISTEKPATIPTINPQDVELDKYNEEAHIKEEIENKIEDILANLKPLEETNENSEDQNEAPKTYGMRLTGDHGYVWNDLWSDPGISFDVGNTDKVEEKDEDKKPVPRPDEDIPKPSPNIENPNPVEDKVDSNQDIFVNVNKDKPNKGNANKNPDLVANKDDIKDILEEPEPNENDLMKNPNGMSEDKTNLNEGLVENIPEEPKLGNNEKDEKNPTEKIDLGNNEKDSKVGDKMKPDQNIDEAKNPDKRNQKYEAKNKKDKDDSKIIEGKKPDAEVEAKNPGQENKDTEQNKPNTLDELMKNEIFWKWLAKWTSTYMEVLTKHIKKIIKEEVENQMKAYLEGHKDDNAINNKDVIPLESKKEETKEETKEITPDKDSKGPVVKNNTLIVDGKEIPITHNSNFDDKDNEELLKRRKDKDDNKLPFPIPEQNKLPNPTINNKEENKTSIPNTNNTKTVENNEKPPISISAQTIYGNSAGTDKVTNIYIFYTNKNSEQILEEIKPANDSANIFIFDQQKNVTNIKDQKGNESNKVEDIVTHMIPDQNKKPLVALNLNKENEDPKATVNETKKPDKSSETVDNKDSTSGQNKEENKEENKTENKDESKPEDKEEAKLENKEESKSENKDESKPEDKEEAKLENKEENKTENKDESKPEDKEEAKLENKDESKSENKDESKPEDKDGSKLENKDESKPEDKEEPIVENREDTKPGNKDENKPEMKEEANVDNKGGSENKEEAKEEDIIYEKLVV